MKFSVRFELEILADSLDLKIEFDRIVTPHARRYFFVTENRDSGDIS